MEVNIKTKFQNNYYSSSENSLEFEKTGKFDTNYI